MLALFTKFWIVPSILTLLVFIIADNLMEGRKFKELTKQEKKFAIFCVIIWPTIYIIAIQALLKTFRN